MFVFKEGIRESKNDPLPYQKDCGLNTHRCHPRYLGPKAHAKLAKKDAFDGLRIHTDELMEVISRISPSTLTIAIVSALMIAWSIVQRTRLTSYSSWTLWIGSIPPSPLPKNKSWL
jgi:hypothetical protein